MIIGIYHTSPSPFWRYVTLAQSDIMAALARALVSTCGYGRANIILYFDTRRGNA